MVRTWCTGAEWRRCHDTYRAPMWRPVLFRVLHRSGGDSGCGGSGHGGHRASFDHPHRPGGRAAWLPCSLGGRLARRRCLLSPEMWRRFVWRYFSRVVHEVVDSGLIAVLHLDSGWTRELSHFRELPRGRCILALDGTTDIFEAKSVLGDHLCVMGDVPATMTFRIDSLAEQIWTDEHPLPW